MYRGTTPTLTFRLPIDTGSITALSLAVAQGGVVRIEKGLADMTLEGKTVSCTLTEEETLSLSAGAGREAQVQLRVGVGGQRMAHPYHIIFRRRQRTEGVICNLESGQPMPTLQIKRIIVCVDFHRLSEKFFYFLVEDNLLLEDVSTGLRRLNHLNALAMCATRVTCLQSRNRFLCHSSKMLMIT